MSSVAESAVTLTHATEQLGLYSPVRFHFPSFQRSALSTSKPHWPTVTCRPGELPLAYLTCKHRSARLTGTYMLK